eukprot:UN23600
MSSMNQPLSEIPTLYMENSTNNRHVNDNSNVSNNLSVASANMTNTSESSTEPPQKKLSLDTKFNLLKGRLLQFAPPEYHIHKRKKDKKNKQILIKKSHMIQKTKQIFSGIDRTEWIEPFFGKFHSIAKFDWILLVNSLDSETCIYSTIIEFYQISCRVSINLPKSLVVAQAQKGSSAKIRKKRKHKPYHNYKSTESKRIQDEKRIFENEYFQAQKDLREIKEFFSIF